MVAWSTTKALNHHLGVCKAIVKSKAKKTSEEAAEAKKKMKQVSLFAQGQRQSGHHLVEVSARLQNMKELTVWKI